MVIFTSEEWRAKIKCQCELIPNSNKKIIVEDSYCFHNKTGNVECFDLRLVNLKPVLRGQPNTIKNTSSITVPVCTFPDFEQDKCMLIFQMLFKAKINVKQ